MSFSRVNPTSWAVGDQLTSAQMNQLDIDHSLSLKGGNTTATLPDQLWSQVTIAGGGQIKAAATAAIVVNIANALQGNIAGAIQPNVTGGIQSAVVGGIQPTVAGGIAAAIAAGIQSGVLGGIQLSAGSADWVTFSAARSVLRSFGPRPVDPSGIGGGSPKWDYSSFAGILVGHATSTSMLLWLERPHNGALLSSVTMFFAVGQAHSGQPATLPSVSIFRTPVAGALGFSAPFAQALSTSATQTVPWPGSTAAWFNSNNVQSFTYTCNQNNSIDTVDADYVIQIIDENGSNALSGNQYVGFQANYTQIADMHFP